MFLNGGYFLLMLLLFASTSALAIYFIRTLEAAYSGRYFQNPSRKPSTVKNILLWNSFFGKDDFSFGLGSEPFVANNCSVIDCFVTNERDSLSIQNFNAVVFHGAEYDPAKRENRPASRASFQRYVYFSMESPSNRPASKAMGGFFNLTVTHRLDSDIPLPYFYMADAAENIVSPTSSPRWMTPALDDDALAAYSTIYERKKRPIAWFSSNCKSKNGREKRVKNLQKFINVDVYGDCGPLKCPRAEEVACFKKLHDDYFFYLSYENSNCDDYVTEKVLNAILNDVIPVVYGGADLSRFLPPHSYIDADRYSAADLSLKLKSVMKNRKEFAQYFWWKSFYHVADSQSPFCKLCELLHADDYEPKVYDDMVEWWHGNSSHRVCSS